MRTGMRLGRDFFWNDAVPWTLQKLEGDYIIHLKDTALVSDIPSRCAELCNFQMKNCIISLNASLLATDRHSHKSAHTQQGLK